MISVSEALTGYHLVSMSVLLSWVVLLITNVRLMPRLKKEPRYLANHPKVSVLVPARNESRNIDRCVRSLVSQDYPNFEVIVLDDRSEDGTADVVRALGLNEANGGLVCGAPLPVGWVGKNWACDQLARVADGEFLFFTDADTEHDRGVIGCLVSTACSHGADLVSVWPKQEVVGWSEKLVVSLLPFLGVLFYPHALLRLLGRYPRLRGLVPRYFRRILGAANGQALFFSRDGYRAIGGHEALRWHLVEDIALGRAMAERMGEGRWWVNVDSAGMIRCRMYRSFWEVWEGFTKNIRAAFEARVWSFVFVGVGQVAFFILPFVLLWIPDPSRHWAVCEVSLILGLRALATLFAGGSWWSVLLHPVAYILAVAIGLNSWRRSVGSGVIWKGRLYAVEVRQKEVVKR